MISRSPRYEDQQNVRLSNKKRLANRAGNHNEAWALCGDFDEVRIPEERLNCVFMENRAKRFNEFIQSNNLIEVPMGALFYADSDHCPHLSFYDEVKNFGQKPIKVFDSWLDDKEAEQLIMTTWTGTIITGPRKDSNFMVKLKKTKASLKLWSDKKYGQLDKEIDKFKSIAQSLEIKAESSTLSERELDDWKEVRKCWFNKEKIKTNMMKQKAQVRWALEGDENPKYFHSVIRNNYNRNNIRGLNIDGIWNDNPLDIKQATLNHFSKIFEEPNISRPSLEDLHYLSISHTEVADLEISFSETEILDAINECGSTKAPGPEGFNLRFFKKYWDTIKDDLIEAIS
ncbi:uncharacterized protein [Rutidosis leptorrhynchoides]|uniref:uncharacterized protein n=1 Tax=Rutidosis leptorrhynchoides TaxID=125765 RepID=UPI003A998CB6